MKISKIVLSAAIAATMAAATAAVASAETAEVTGEVVAISTDSTAEAVATTAEAETTLKIFAPPASGENDPSQGADWQTNYYTTITKLPNIRIRFAPIIEG